MSTMHPWQPTSSTAMEDTACVNFGGDLHLYATGFREGAEALLEVVRTTGQDQDVLVYPIVYGLRHSVELLLKQVIRAARQLVSEPGDFPDGHRLGNLWNTCKPILRQIWPNNSSSYLKVDSVIASLSVIDPEGEAFRYPVSTKRQGVRSPTLDPDMRHLDLGALVADVMEVIELLDGADTGITEYIDARYEMEADAREMQAEMKAEFEAEMRAEYEAEMRAEYRSEMSDW